MSSKADFTVLNLRRCLTVLLSMASNVLVLGFILDSGQSVVVVQFAKITAFHVKLSQMYSPAYNVTLTTYYKCSIPLANAKRA